MKRKAYIGLSSPTAYFYDHKNKYEFGEYHWNPILESPQGLITLFDELWFLSRALCPVSFRNESYVKFLDEDSSFTSLITDTIDRFCNDGSQGLIRDFPFVAEALILNEDYSPKQFGRYTEVISSVYGNRPGRLSPIDNHSHSINILQRMISGNSMSLDLIVLDLVILARLGIKNIEFITNTFNSAAFRARPHTIDKTKIAQGITIKRIPVLQTPRGPVIDRIESIRENNFLIDFRNKIQSTTNPEEFTSLIDGIENEFNRYRNEVLLKKQSSARIMNSLGKNAVSAIIGAVVPGAGEIKSFKEDMSARPFNWTGFLAELELNINGDS